MSSLQIMEVVRANWRLQFSDCRKETWILGKVLKIGQFGKPSITSRMVTICGNCLSNERLEIQTANMYSIGIGKFHKTSGPNAGATRRRRLSHPWRCL